MDSSSSSTPEFGPSDSIIYNFVDPQATQGRISPFQSLSVSDAWETDSSPSEIGSVDEEEITESQLGSLNQPAQGVAGSATSAALERARNFFSNAVANPIAQFGYLRRAAHEDSEGDDARVMVDPATSASMPEYRKPSTTMFVTIGATASFKQLIDEVVQDKFLEALAEVKIDRLVVQCGPDLRYFEKIRPTPGLNSNWIHISSFDYTDNMQKEMMACTPNDGKDGKEVRGVGVIVCHAGSGTILRALKVNAKVIVVPNSSLMDNHQEELADMMAEKGYVVRAKLGRVREAVLHINEFAPANWPPKPPANAIYGTGMRGILRDVRPLVAEGDVLYDAPEEDEARLRLD